MKTLPGMQYQRFVHIDRLSHAPQDQNSPKLTPKIQKKQMLVFNFSFSSELHLIIVKTERTYCLTTVCNETCSLLKGFLKVVLESLVFILFRPQLHEFTWNLSMKNINNRSTL